MNQVGEDPYIWMEDLSSSKLIKWVSMRNQRTLEVLSTHRKILREKLEKYFNLPVILRIAIGKSGYYALIRDSQHFRIVKLGKDYDEEVISSSELGKDAVIKSLRASTEEDVIVFSYSIGGSDVGYTLLLKPSTKEVLDKLYGVIGDVLWLGDNKYYYVRIYYDQKTPDGVEPPATRVFLRENGVEEMVFKKELPSLYFIGLSKSTDSSKALVTISYGWTSAQVYAGDLKLPENWRYLYGSKDFISYPIDYAFGKYLLLSFDDLEGTGRIVSVDKEGIIREVVKPVRYPIHNVVLLREKKLLVVHYLINASSHLMLYNIEGALLGELKFEPQGFIDSLETDGRICVFKYESFTIPYRVYEFNGSDLTPLKSEEVDEKYLVEETWVKSKDGTPIHFFRVRNKEKSIGSALVYGYGGFRIPIVPRFTPFILPLVDDGFEYVVVNTRGGGEYGERWHREGMREKKQNVFDDFISVLEHLKIEGRRVFAYGVSNGGLLIGATFTQRPDLLDGAIISYPVLDMLRFDKLFIGKLWTTEFGDPESTENREYLIKYSPYHNIKAGITYPPVMLITGLKDDRVHPAHAFKFAAKLEEIGVTYLLRVDEESGHSGATPSRKIDEYTDILAFIYMFSPELPKTTY